MPGSGAVAPASQITVGTVLSVEQAHETARKVARRLRSDDSVRVKPLEVDNIVCTFSLGVSDLNLAAVATSLHGRLGAWQPKTNNCGRKTAFLESIQGVDQRFPSCVSRCRETRTTNSIFNSSQVVVGGAKSPASALASAYLCAERIRFDLGYNTGVYNFRVQNVVSSFGLGYRLNLKYFYFEHYSECNWDPEEFRGIAWELPSKIVIVLFDTGNAVVTGKKTFEDLKGAYEMAVGVLSRYRLGAEKMQIPAEMLHVPRKKVKNKVPVTKTRKERMLQQGYKKTESMYLEQIRAKNEEERIRAGGAEIAKPASRVSKRKRAAVKDRADDRIAQRLEAEFQWKRPAFSMISLKPMAPYPASAAQSIDSSTSVRPAAVESDRPTIQTTAVSSVGHGKNPASRARSAPSPGISASRS